jgi:Rad3-related DNA helicase
MERELIKISVRELVEFILRSGDIDNRVGGKKDAQSMLAGARIHRKIQRSMGSDYHAEVTLKHLIPMGEFDLQIEGRADGIIDGNPVTIDEIKGVYKSLEYLKEPVAVHLAQAKCYAYIYGVQNGQTMIDVQMTYVNLDTEQKIYFIEHYTIEELSEWFQGVVAEYQKWAKFRYEWKLLRNASIKEVQFPYEYRAGQKDLAGSVYRSILREKRLFIQAPTGTGKTLATLFPSVKAMGEGLSDKIFYLTAKTITRTVASNCLDLLREQKLRMKSVLLTAKEKMCFCEEINCNPDVCPYAKGHFDRVNDAVFEILNTEKDQMTREDLLEHAKKWQVCPFELSLDVSTWVDAIICDYNYAFDPRAHLKRFFYEGTKDDYIFLVDEAHNLVERARSMYSASICKEDFLELKRLLKGKAPKVEKQLNKCNAHLLELKRECEYYEILKDINALYLQLLTLSGELQEYLEIADDAEIKKSVTDFYLNLRTFLNTYDVMDESYTIYDQLCEDGSFRVHLFCIHPANRLKEYLQHGRGCVFFSATFLPISYYKELLSGDVEDYAVYATSCFPPENQLVFTAQDVTTKYTRRNQKEYEKISEYIEKTIQARKGNYLIFFPSYEMLESVYGAFVTSKIAKHCTCKLQNVHMTEEEREAFLAEFEKEQESSLLGFCVMGGIFSEGIDLAEERLIGAIIVGTGLPKVCVERELLKQYFDQKGLGGFDYAYIYPGMNKVLQSAGRVIRTATDKGCVLLLDERFARNEYKRLFPREWKQPVFGNISDLSNVLENFWEE